jgi:hypothetical protein
MGRRPVAIVLLAVASLSFLWFMGRVTTRPVTDADLWLNFIATTTATWGIILLVGRGRLPRWVVMLLAGLTVAGSAITAALALNLPG